MVGLTGGIGSGKSTVAGSCASWARSSSTPTSSPGRSSRPAPTAWPRWWRRSAPACWRPTAASTGRRWAGSCSPTSRSAGRWRGSSIPGYGPARPRWSRPRRRTPWSSTTCRCWWSPDWPAASSVVMVVLADRGDPHRAAGPGPGHERGGGAARIAAQATDDQRRAVADMVIVNDATQDELRRRSRRPGTRRSCRGRDGRAPRTSERPVFRPRMRVGAAAACREPALEACSGRGEPGREALLGAASLGGRRCSGRRAWAEALLRGEPGREALLRAACRESLSRAASQVAVGPPATAGESRSPHRAPPLGEPDGTLARRRGCRPVRRDRPDRCGGLIGPAAAAGGLRDRRIAFA